MATLSPCATCTWAGVGSTYGQVPRALLMIQPGYHHALLLAPSVLCIKQEQVILAYPLLLSYLSYGAVRLEDDTPPLNIGFELCSEV